MKSTGQNSDSPGPGYEATLYMLTHAPVPDGLEDRVYAALEAAPKRGAVLAWPMAGWATGWMRATAEAAIVAVVAGGGWGVYRHAQQHQPSKVVVMPAPQMTAPAASGFSSAGAVRTPQTVTGPAAVEIPKAKPARKHRLAKPKAAAARSAANSAQAGAAK